MKSPSGRDPNTVVARSTARVKTKELQSQGVSQLRCLSESKFLQLIEQLVEERVARRLAELGAVPAHPFSPHDLPIVVDQEFVIADGTSGTAAPPEDAWSELSHRHVDALESLEARLVGLSDDVKSMENALEALPRDGELGDPTKRRRDEKRRLIEGKKRRGEDPGRS